MNPVALLIFAIAALIFLISFFRLHAFIALLAVAIGVGISAGLSPVEAVKAFQTGLGSMLSSITTIVAFGAVLGQFLGQSGSAQRLAEWVIRLFGRQRMEWAMASLGLVIGLPVFFGVGVVLTAPILFNVISVTGLSMVRAGLPLLAGLSAAHGLIPPHPGPIAAAALLEADIGKTLLFGLIVGTGATIFAGPLLARWLDRRVVVPVDKTIIDRFVRAPQSTLPLGWALLMIATPIFLMMVGSIGDLVLAPGAALRTWLDFAGSPTIALLIAVLVAAFLLRRFTKTSSKELLSLTEQSLLPVASVLLVVGAGGGLNQVLMASGISTQIVQSAGRLEIPLLLLAWMVAALIRIATGSATVAISTTAGLIAPLAKALPNSNRELLVISMGAGSLILSHLNDGGFWFVKEYLGLSVRDTLRTWTVMETVLSVASLVLVLLLAAINH